MIPEVPTRQVPSDLYGRRARYNTLSGTIIDPSTPVKGYPFKGSQPDQQFVWLYLDPQHHSRMDGFIGQDPGPRHGLWVRLNNPHLIIEEPAVETANEESTKEWQGAG